MNDIKTHIRKLNRVGIKSNWLNSGYINSLRFERLFITLLLKSKDFKFYNTITSK